MVGLARALMMDGEPFGLSSLMVPLSCVVLARVLLGVMSTLDAMTKTMAEHRMGGNETKRGERNWWKVGTGETLIQYKDFC